MLTTERGPVHVTLITLCGDIFSSVAPKQNKKRIKRESNCSGSLLWWILLFKYIMRQFYLKEMLSGNISFVWHHAAPIDLHTKAIEVITGKQCYKPPSLCCSSWFPSWLTHPPAFIVSDSTRQWKHLPSNKEQGVSWTASSKCVCIFKPSELFLLFLLFLFYTDRIWIIFPISNEFMF